MSQIRTILSVSLLWLAHALPANAVEVLPMDSVEPECNSTQAVEADAAPGAAQEVAESIIESAEAPSGLQAVGASATPARAAPQGGGDTSIPPAAKPSSRWNAFLPGMVR